MNTQESQKELRLSNLSIEMDPDVKKVLEFMQQNISCSKLVGVANAIQNLATPIWGHFQKEEVIILALRHLPLDFDDERLQLVANE